MTELDSIQDPLGMMVADLAAKLAAGFGRDCLYEPLKATLAEKVATLVEGLTMAGGEYDEEAARYALAPEWHEEYDLAKVRADLVEFTRSCCKCGGAGVLAFHAHSEAIEEMTPLAHDADEFVRYYCAAHADHVMRHAAHEALGRNDAAGYFNQAEEEDYVDAVLRGLGWEEARIAATRAV